MHPFLSLYNAVIAGMAADSGFPDIQKFCKIEMTEENRLKFMQMAMDAEPASNKILDWTDAVFFPGVMEIFTTPLTAGNILNVEQFGSFETPVAIAYTDEISGHIAGYGDFNRHGASDVNGGSRTVYQYKFQTMMSIGDLEARVTQNGLNLLERKERAAATVINKGHNDIWLYGVDGTNVYGFLNHPELPMPITPTTGAGGLEWADKTAAEIFADISLLVTTLIEQLGDLYSENLPLSLMMSAKSYGQLTKNNQYTDKTVGEIIKATWPNITIKTAADFDKPAGNTVMLMADYVEHENGTRQDTTFAGYSVLMQGHGKLRDASSMIEKKSAGNWGTTIWMPLAIVSMLGI